MKVDKKLKLTFLIVKRDVSNKVIAHLKNQGIDKYFSFYGKGSASVAVLDYLGIGEIEKNILVYPSNEEKSFDIIEFIKNSEYLKDIVAFRIPVKGISSIKILNYFFEEENQDE